MSDLRCAIGLVEKDMADGGGAAGTSFTMADCAAAPALYYVNRLIPYAQGYPNTARYLERLIKRPAVARAIEEAAPYAHMLPL